MSIHDLFVPQDTRNVETMYTRKGGMVLRCTFSAAQGSSSDAAGGADGYEEGQFEDVLLFCTT